jgi:hypothetical protein
VGDKSGGSRRGLGVGLEVPGEGLVRPKKRTRKVNSAEALSRRTKLMERKIASTGKIYYQHHLLSRQEPTSSLSSAMYANIAPPSPSMSIFEYFNLSYTALYPSLPTSPTVNPSNSVFSTFLALITPRALV